MENKQLENFGKMFITEVRDNSIFILESIINGHMKDEQSKKFNEELKKFSPEDIKFIKNFAVSMIDTCIHNTMFMFEGSEEWIISNGDDVENINDISDGLSGELYSDRGWIKKYSKYKSSL